MDNITIHDYERLDDLHRSGYMIIQDPKRFCFGIDAVLLSSFAKAKPNEYVLDLGTGTGVIPLLIEAKTKAKYLEGIEIQKESADMAQRSVKYNGLCDKVKITHGDIKDIKSLVKPGSFDVVTSNPPYMIEGGGIVPDYSPKAVARHELLVNLDEIISAAAYALKFKGRFYMVHRPFRLTDIICTLRKYKLEPKTIRFVQPYADKEANMVLIEAVSGGGSMVKVTDALVVYDKNGQYTRECYDIYYG
jgi:tRNA1Val (adenine37-N6)-methyltransferase